MKIPERENRQFIPKIKTFQRNLIVILITSIFATTFLVAFSPWKQEGGNVFYGDLVTSTSSAIALTLSFLIVYKQKIDGLIGKAYLSLAIGLGYIEKRNISEKRLLSIIKRKPYERFELVRQREFFQLLLYTFIPCRFMNNILIFL